MGGGERRRSKRRPQERERRGAAAAEQTAAAADRVGRRMEGESASPCDECVRELGKANVLCPSYGRKLYEK